MNIVISVKRKDIKKITVGTILVIHRVLSLKGKGELLLIMPALKI